MRHWLSIAFVATGCAARPTAPPPEKGTPSSIEEAGARLDEAERALQEALLRGRDGDEVFASEPTNDDAPAPATRAEAKRRGVDRCTRACRALGSMARSTEALCSLTGDEDDRCRGARRRLVAARHLVEQACPRCATG